MASLYEAPTEIWSAFVALCGLPAQEIATATAEIGESILTPPERVQITTTRVARDTTEVRRLKTLYDYRCQVCGERIEYGPQLFYAQVHHIRPLGGQHQGIDKHDNMLVVCPTHHAMFDLGVPFFWNYNTIQIYNNVIKLTIMHQIEPKNVDYHNDKIVRVTSQPTCLEPSSDGPRLPRSLASVSDPTT